MLIEDCLDIFRVTVVDNTKEGWHIEGVLSLIIGVGGTLHFNDELLALSAAAFHSEDVDYVVGTRVLNDQFSIDRTHQQS